jgi:Uma2 family endonuclease
MNAPLRVPRRPDPLYPDSDGQPMAENTLQFEWIVTIKENLELLFLDRPDVFVAGDLLWYAVEGDPTMRLAPDALVVFGRPKGYRGSYQQWLEDGIAPQVVFEVLSPGNRFGEMLRKHRFYERYGVEEYYLWDPERIVLEGWRREDGSLREIQEIDGWVSPRLGVRFAFEENVLRIYGPDGRPFRTFPELERQRVEAERRADEARQQADEARQQADEARKQADETRERNERLMAQLRALGVEPEK